VEPKGCYFVNTLLLWHYPAKHPPPRIFLALFLMIPKGFLLSTIGKKVTKSGGAFQKMQKIVMFSFLVYLESTLPSIKTQQAL
jgi:hypothetical protein